MSSNFAFDERDILTLNLPSAGRVQHDDGTIGEPVPAYTETDSQPFEARLDRLNAECERDGIPNPLALPITTWPEYNSMCPGRFTSLRPLPLGCSAPSSASAVSLALDATATPPLLPSSSPSSITTTITTLPTQATTTKLSSSPPSPTNVTPEALARRCAEHKREAVLLSREIISFFFDCIEHKRDDVASALIGSGLIGPMTPNAHGETPLMAAVRVGNLHMVRRLAQLGAPVDELGHLPLDENLRAERMGRGFERRRRRVKWGGGGGASASADAVWEVRLGPERTPLMVAAERGNLAVAKMLMEEFGANDAIVAPDGQIALRLAGRNRHREVVEYLPLRRGGAWRRWKVANRKYMEVARAAALGITGAVVLVGYVLPRAIIWSFPKHIFKFLWGRRKRAGRWCKRQVSELPGRMRTASEKVGRGLKKVPEMSRRAAKGTWKALKKLPKFLNKILEVLWDVGKWTAKFLWRATKATPGVAKKISLWLWEGIEKVGAALGKVGVAMASLIHTALMAIVNFFRGITLGDVWNGFVALLKAIFVSVPQALWSFLKKFGNVSLDAMDALFGLLGVVVWAIGAGIIWLVKYIPERVGRIIAAIGMSIGKGVEEILVWFNPKRVSPSVGTD
ncbi:uncharacterized protein MKZ38_005598 [Zalerion maritima]|uniref:Ankyrin n=1 Tax=Zalerion maritima TaxID=339359 RepID=A0AAD5RL50_9PEZI|nr:uncharacterized protein MKZ38_005598 [Zalerion maritima]